MSSEIEIKTTFIDKEDMKVAAINNGKMTFFLGITTDSNALNKIYTIDRTTELLIRAVNNRTRERNYFRKCVELLQGFISEEDFDKEITNNEDDYVIIEDQEADLNDMGLACFVSQKIKDVNDANDMLSLFSFSHESLNKCLDSK